MSMQNLFFTQIPHFFFSYPERLCLAIQSLKEVPLLFLQLHLCLFEFFLLYSMAFWAAPLLDASILPKFHVKERMILRPSTFV